MWEQKKDLTFLFWMKIWMMLLKIMRPLEYSGVLIDRVTEITGNNYSK